MKSGQDAVIVFIAEADYQLVATWSDTQIPIVVEELASVGMDVWLGALAYGAAAVLLIDTGSVPEGVAQALNQQLSTAQSLLAGMHYAPGLIQYVTIAPDSSSASVKLPDLNLPVMPAINVAVFAGLNSKRQALFLAIDHLNAQADSSPDEILLPAWAPIGRIHVDANRCTLCMGCTSVCPASAVTAGGEEPRLLFTEANCTQCGLCQSACPEQAIQLQPTVTY